MTTKEKIIIKSINEVTRQIAVLEDIIYSNPLLEVINIRIEAQKFLENNKTLEQRTNKKFGDKITELANKEKKLMEKAKKRQNSIELIEEEVKLKMELSDLNNELCHIQRHKI